MEELGRWKDALIRGLAVLLSAGAVSWCCWVTISLYERPVSAQVFDIVATKSPYIQDKGKLDLAIQAMRDDRSDMLQVVRENTRAIQSIEKQLAALAAVLDDRDEAARRRQ